MVFEGFDIFNVKVNSSPEVVIHGVKAGSGPPLLLLHGYPQTHRIWNHIAPTLTKNFTVIAMDLRGYGKSSKPAGPPDPSTYSKSTMARDCVNVMSHFGFSDFLVCSHDRGARVAHKLCVDHPSTVRKVMVLDICPTAAMYAATNFEFAYSYYHWFFLIQPFPIPEDLINANSDKYVEGHFSSKYAGLDAFTRESLEAYKAQMRDPDMVHASCEDYRAAASIDLEEFNEDEEMGRRVKCPLMVLWGKHGVIENCFDAVAEWRKVCDGPVTGEAVDSGHYIPEEVPDVLLEKMLVFFRD